MSTMVENTLKFLVSAMLATVATVVVGGMVAVSVGTASDRHVAGHDRDLQAHSQAATAAKPCQPA